MEELNMKENDKLVEISFTICRPDSDAMATKVSLNLTEQEFKDMPDLKSDKRMAGFMECVYRKIEEWRGIVVDGKSPLEFGYINQKQ